MGVELPLDPALRLICYRPLDLLPLAIEDVELPGGRGAESGLLAQEQIDGKRGVGEAPARVDARPEAERNVSRRESVARIDTRDVHQGAKPGPLGGLEHAEPVAREDAVLALQGHKVRDGSKRNQIEMVAQTNPKGHGVVLGAEAFEQPVAELEHQSHGAQVQDGSGGLRPGAMHVGIDQQPVLQRPFRGAVMIDHQHVDAQTSQVGRLGVGIGATVQRDEKIGAAALERAVDRAARKTVTVLGAAGHHVTRIEAEAPEHGDEQRGAADSINIVVPEHDDLLPIRDSPREPSRGGLDVGQEKRILQLRQGGLQKIRGGRG